MSSEQWQRLAKHILFLFLLGDLKPKRKSENIKLEAEMLKYYEGSQIDGMLDGAKI